jgi:hypothetical protein
MYTRAGNNSSEFMGVLKDERNAMEELLARDNIRLRLLLWPVRSYDPEFLHIRFENFLQWMNDVSDMPNIEFRVGHYSDRNRLIVSDDFLLEGYKVKETSGYEMSVVRYQSSNIDDAIHEFERNWSPWNQTKKEVISEIERMRAEIL